MFYRDISKIKAKKKRHNIYSTNDIGAGPGAGSPRSTSMSSRPWSITLMSSSELVFDWLTAAV
jgi:hypothetical protein